MYEFSVKWDLKEKFYIDFFYKILNNRKDELHIKRLKFICYCWLNTEKIIYFLIKFIICFLFENVVNLNKKINNLYFLKCKKQILKKGEKRKVD